MTYIYIYTWNPCTICISLCGQHITARRSDKTPMEIDKNSCCYVCY